MRCFNPRSHMGSDQPIRRKPPSVGCFNPRSHMGSDISASSRVTCQSGFNPRSHMGSDVHLVWYVVRLIDVSIHAPTWGATFADKDNYQIIVFQSTLPHGERRKAVAASSECMLFQSTLPHGERPDRSLHHSARLGRFNPRSHMGSDSCLRCNTPA